MSLARLVSPARLWPRSLGGRTVAVLLAAVILVHLGSMMVYRESAVDAANTAQVIQLAERLASTAQVIAGRPASDPMRDLS